MTEEILKCEYYDNGKCFNYDVSNPWCEDEDNCAAYQLKRLEQENKELKNKNICRETCEYFKRICNENTLLIKYRSALEEIRQINNKWLKRWMNDSDELMGFEEIGNKLNEVLG